MRLSQTIALISTGLAMASCSAEPKSVDGASLSGGGDILHGRVAQEAHRAR